MFRGVLRAVVHWILLLALCQYAAATDSEIVEAETYPSPSAAASNMPELLPPPQWRPNDTVLVKPYNILEVSCPQGYVLANKHCHKRVRGAPTME